MTIGVDESFVTIGTTTNTMIIAIIRSLLLTIFIVLIPMRVIVDVVTRTVTRMGEIEKFLLHVERGGVRG